jgi:hypothetical protein
MMWVAISALSVLAGGCSQSPPEPPAQMLLPQSDLQALVPIVQSSPLALFHPDAGQIVRQMGNGLRVSVQRTNELYSRTSAGSGGSDGLQQAEASAILVGQILGTVERCLRCAESAGMVRSEVERTMALMIESAGAYGLAEELPEGADVKAFVRDQARVVRLGLPLYLLAKSIPHDLRDDMYNARLRVLELPCPE